MDKRIYTVEELTAFPPYTPFVGYARAGMLQGLFHQSPNGRWWLAGDCESYSPDYFVGVFSEGIVPLSVPETINSRKEDDATGN